VGLLVVGGPASAQTTSASAQYEQGISLREQRRNDEALAVFRRLYEATHEARALAQVALAEGELGRLVDAEAHLVEALAHSGERWIRHNRRSLETALVRLRTHLGYLTVACPTPGAELWIGGQRATTLPMVRPLRVATGTVAFEVRADGFVPLSRSVQVSTAPLLEQVELQPQVTVAAEVMPPQVVAPPPVVAPTPMVVPVRSPPQAPRAGTGGMPRRSGRRALAWVGFGGAATLVAGGAVAIAVRESAAARYNVAGCLGDGVPVESEPTAACRDDRETVSTMQTLGVVGLIAGGALAVGSVVWLVTSPGRDGNRERSGAASVRCGGGPGTIGLACGGPF
jgi:hypothetical protein